MYGAKYVGNLYGSVQPQATKFQVTALSTITKGDLVNLVSGLIEVAGTGDAILGLANETVVGNAGGTTYVDIIIAKRGDVYLMDNDESSGAIAATEKGTYFATDDGGTGAQQVQADTGGTTVNQLMLIDINPLGYGVDDDTSMGLFTPVETMLTATTKVDET